MTPCSDRRTPGLSRRAFLGAAIAAPVAIALAACGETEDGADQTASDESAGDAAAPSSSPPSEVGAAPAGVRIEVWRDPG